MKARTRFLSSSMSNSDLKFQIANFEHQQTVFVHVYAILPREFVHVYAITLKNRINILVTLTRLLYQGQN